MSDKKQGFLKRAVGNAKALYDMGVAKWKGARADQDRNTVMKPRMMRQAHMKSTGEDLADPNRPMDATAYDYHQLRKAKDAVKAKVMKRARRARLGIQSS